MAVALNLALPEQLEAHLAFVANLNCAAREYEPLYDNFTVWSYLPASTMTISLIAYLATLPIPEGGYPNHVLLLQGHYISRNYPHLNVFSIADEFYLDYVYLASKYSYQTIVDYITQRLTDDPENLPISIIKKVVIPLAEQDNLYLRYLLLYYMLTDRSSVLQQYDMMTISSIVELPDFQLRKLASVDDEDLLLLLRANPVIRQRLNQLRLPEFLAH